MTVATKVLIDQTCWAPVFMVMFFTYGCVFDGEPHKIVQKCKNDIFTAVKVRRRRLASSRLISSREGGGGVLPAEAAMVRKYRAPLPPPVRHHPHT